MSRRKHDCAFLFLQCRASTILAAHDKSQQTLMSFVPMCSHVLISVAGTPVIRCVWDLACSFTVVRFICCVCLRTEVLLKSRKMAANAYIYIYIYVLCCRLCRRYILRTFVPRFTSSCRWQYSMCTSSLTSAAAGSDPKSPSACDTIQVCSVPCGIWRSMNQKFEVIAKSVLLPKRIL